MKTIKYSFMAIIVMIIAIITSQENKTIAQTLPDWPPSYEGMCRCHPSQNYSCLGGNTISLRRQCGSIGGCRAGGNCRPNENKD
jgi:hypothetical protein